MGTKSAGINLKTSKLRAKANHTHTQTHNYTILNARARAGGSPTAPFVEGTQITVLNARARAGESPSATFVEDIKLLVPLLPLVLPHCFEAKARVFKVWCDVRVLTTLCVGLRVYVRGREV